MKVSKKKWKLWKNHYFLKSSLLVYSFYPSCPFLWKENYTYFHSFMLVKLLKITLSLFETFWKLWIFAKNFKMQPILWVKFLKLCLFFQRFFLLFKKKRLCLKYFFSIAKFKQKFQLKSKKKTQILITNWVFGKWMVEKQQI